MNNKELHLSDYIRKLNQVNPIEFKIKSDILFKHASELLDKDKTPNEILSSFRSVRKKERKIIISHQPKIISNSNKIEKTLFLKKLKKPQKDSIAPEKDIAKTYTNSVDSSRINRITLNKVCLKSVLKGRIVKKCIDNLNKTQLEFVRERQKELAATKGKRANDLKYVLDNYFSDNYHLNYFNTHNQFIEDLSILETKKKELPEIKNTIESIERVTTQIHVSNIHLSNDIAFINKTFKRINNVNNNTNQKGHDKKTFSNNSPYKFLSFYQVCALAKQNNPLHALKIKKRNPNQTNEKTKENEFNEEYLNCFSEGSNVNTQFKTNNERNLSLSVSTPTPLEIKQIKQDKKLSHLLNTCSIIERRNKKLKYKLKRVKQ